MAEPTLLITTRGMRVVYTLEAIAVGLVALAVASLGGGETAEGAEWASLPPAEALAAAPCPDPGSIDLGNLNADELDAARAGSFEVFGSEPTKLTVPVDWAEDPLGAHRYRQNLHKLRFLAPLLTSWRDTGNTTDLEQALGLGVDWVEQNPRGEEGTPVEAWSDKVTGDRIPFLTYLLRAAACEDVGTPEQRQQLSDSLVEHGKVLAAGRLYTPDNHGLFVDLGLVRLVDSLPYMPQAERWRSKAHDRFVKTLRGRLADGIWLEHSSAYQFLAIRALERMLAAYGPDEELEGLLAEMRDAATWFVKPDGVMTQFGDSDQEGVPDWAAPGITQTGLHPAADAGFAFVRAPGPDGELGYLAVTDGFHNTTHKHADELSFLLYDEGVDIVSDTGLYDKDPGPVRDFVVSNRAHSTLVVDGLDLPIGDGANAYGSGLAGTGEGDGWYAIDGRNRLLAASQDVKHSRTFLYRPGELLVIVDRVRSPATHTYTRYLQLGRDIELGKGERDGDPAFRLGPVGGAIYDGPGTVPSEASETRGQEEPLQGFTSPSFRRFVPRSTVAFAAQGASETFVTTIALDEGLPAVSSAEANGSTVTLGFDDGRTVEAVRDGDAISVSDSAG